jgi:hypothetical protein
VLRLVVRKVLERSLEGNGAGQNRLACMPVAHLIHVHHHLSSSGSKSEVCPVVCQLCSQTTLLVLILHASMDVLLIHASEEGYTCMAL